MKVKILNFLKDIKLLIVKIEKFLLDMSVAMLGILGPDAAALWKIASTKFQKGTDYINKNGYIIENIRDLNDEKLEKEVRQKIESQLHKSEAKGILFYENSTLAKSVVKTKEFKNFIKKHYKELTEDKKVFDEHFAFESDLNMFAALHRARVIDIHSDDNKILHAEVIDTIDYNDGEWWVMLPRIIQQHGLLEGYYHVTKIAVPIESFLNN